MACPPARSDKHSLVTLVGRSKVQPTSWVTVGIRKSLAYLAYDIFTSQNKNHLLLHEMTLNTKRQLKINTISTSSKTDTADPPSTRWWESYLVRYFIGFITGCACIVIFGIKIEIFNSIIKNLPTGTSQKADWSPLVWLVAILGLGFCYIASTPITVLHAGRYRRGWLDGHSRHFWFAWISLCISTFLSNANFIGNYPFVEWLLILIATTTLVLQYSHIKNKNEPTQQSAGQKIIPKQSDRIAIELFIGKIIEKTEKTAIAKISLYTAIWFAFFFGIIGRIFGEYGKNLDHSTQIWWILSLPAFWILIGQYAVLYRLLHEKEKLFEFYAKLFKARRMKNARDVRDTYTHLREHSNSVFIVVIELSLFSLTMAVTNTIKINNLGNMLAEKIPTITTFGLILWMIPTVFMWARANSLEAEFSENPNSYLR